MFKNIFLYYKINIMPTYNTGNGSEFLNSASAQASFRYLQPTDQPTAATAFAHTYYAATVDLATGKTLPTGNSSDSNLADTTTSNTITTQDGQTTVDVLKISYYCYLQDNPSIPISCSATCYIPSNCSLNYVISYKHQTYPSVNNKYVGHERFNSTNILNTPNYPDAYYQNYENYIAHQTNYIVVVADDLGYGDNLGKKYYLDKESEVIVQAGAIKALRSFISVNSTVFGPLNNPFNIIQLGYGTGSSFCMSVANKLMTISNDTQSKEYGFYNAANIICGAPLTLSNIYSTLYYINNDSSYGYYYYYYNPDNDDLQVDINVVYMTLLYFGSNLNARAYEATHNLTQDGLALLQWFNTTTGINNTNDPISKDDLMINLAKYLRQAPFNGTIPVDADLSLTNLGLVNIATIVNIDNVKSFFASTTDFTLPNVQLNNVQNIPISIVYSSSDELCEFKGVDGCKQFDSNINPITGKTNIKNRVVNDDIALIGTAIKNVTTNQYYRIKVNSTKSNYDFMATYIDSVVSYLQSL